MKYLLIGLLAIGSVSTFAKADPIVLRVNLVIPQNSNAVKKEIKRSTRALLEDCNIQIVPNLISKQDIKSSFPLALSSTKQHLKLVNSITDTSVHNRSTGTPLIVFYDRDESDSLLGIATGMAIGLKFLSSGLTNEEIDRLSNVILINKRYVSKVKYIFAHELGHLLGEEHFEGKTRDDAEKNIMSWSRGSNAHFSDEQCSRMEKRIEDGLLQAL